MIGGGDMRNTRERIVHAVSFEVSGLLILTVLGSWGLGYPVTVMGTVALVGTTLAMVWVYIYNLAFDRVLVRLTGALRKPIWLRIIHAILFEAGLLIILLPFIAWHLGIGFVEAFWLDLSMAGFYLLYAFAFNWVYDLMFPPGGVEKRG
ncbi:MAG: putative membrane protein [Rhodobacteraceae bacterium HLUCCO07]|nr:MAG: putative membrane protein [Rhodobacteraceae bacterium HLUCCO07]